MNDRLSLRMMSFVCYLRDTFNPPDTISIFNNLNQVLLVEDFSIVTGSLGRLVRGTDGTNIRSTPLKTLSERYTFLISGL